jgi:hypothetical protein
MPVKQRIPATTGRNTRHSNTSLMPSGISNGFVGVTRRSPISPMRAPLKRQLKDKDSDVRTAPFDYVKGEKDR